MGKDSATALKKIAFLQKRYKSKPDTAGEKAESLYDAFLLTHNCTSCARCCKHLGPRITPTDIRTLAKFTGIKEKQLSETYFKSDEDGDIVFKSMPCPFLQDDNLCSVYEARPRACREYPHIGKYDFVKQLDIHRKNYSYCPAIVYVIDKLYEHSQ